MASDEQVQLIFKAVNQYSAVTADLSRRLDDISKRAEAAQEAARDLGETMERDLERGASSAEDLVQGFRNIYQAAKGLLTLWGAQKAIGEILKFGEAGAQVINLKQSFMELADAAGQSSDVALAAMQRMSAGMLSETQLMEQYNRAFLLIGEEVAAKMPELIAIAQRASAAGMGDMQYLLNSLTTGIGRLSPMILDNLGFTVSLSDAYSEYARSVGKAADDLTKAEQQQALLNAVMAQAEAKYGNVGSAADVAGQGIARLRATVEDYTDYLRTQAAPVIDDYANRLANAIRAIMPGTPEYWEQFLADARALVTSQSGGWGAYEARMSGLPDVEAQLRALAEAQDYVNMSAEVFSELYTRASAISIEFARAIQETREAQLHARNEQEHMINTARRLVGGFDDIGSHASGAAKGVNELTAAMQALSKASDISAAISAVDQARKEADARARWRREVEQTRAFDPQMAEQLELAGWYSFIIDDQEAYNQMIITGTSLTEDHWETQRKGAAAASSSYSDLQSAMESYYDSWQSQAAAMLDPTQSLDFTALEAELGMRQEAFDENARRAMAVAERGPEAEREWAELLGLGSRQEALQYVKDFYAGALPEEAYNWDAAIAQFEQKMQGMLGQQRLEGIFQEKLTAAGLGVDSPLVMQALEGPFAGSGVGAAEAFMVSFSDQFNQEDWSGLASGAGEAIKEGILTAARDAGSKFLDELARAVSPHVAKQLAETTEYTP